MADSTVSATAAMVAGGGGPAAPEAPDSGAAAPDPKARAFAPESPAPDGAPELQEFAGIRFGIPYKVLVAAGPDDRPLLEGLVAATLDECGATFDPNNAASELSALNDLPSGVPYPLSDPMSAVLRVAGIVHHLSHGAFDPTVAPLARLWRTALGAGTDPTDREVASLGAVLGWDKVTVAQGSITKGDDDVRLDLGGVAKGWCVDTILETLQAHGYRDAYVDFGGDVRATGRHPHGREWSAAIAAPPLLGAEFDPTIHLEAVDLWECAMATSGDYLRQLPGGYCHLMDPIANRPLRVADKTIAGASVIARTCVVADAAATALCVVGHAPSGLAAAETLMTRLRAAGIGILSHRWFARAVDPGDVVMVRPPSSVRATHGGVWVTGPELPARPLPAPGVQDALRGLMRLVPHMVAVVTAVPHGRPRAASLSLAELESAACEGTPEDTPDALLMGHAATYSSVAPLFQRSGAVGDRVAFNVLRPSRIHLLLSRGLVSTCAIHFLDASQSDAARRYAAHAGGLRGALLSAAYCTAVLPDLTQDLYHCHIATVQDCGDHALVLAEVIGPPDPRGGQALPWEGGGGPLIYAGGYFRLVPPAPLPVALPHGASDVTAPVVVTADKRAPVVGSHLTACSLSPPLVSLVLPVGFDSECPVEGAIRLHLPHSDLHAVVAALAEVAANPWLAMHAALGHRAVDAHSVNGTIDARVQTTVRAPSHWLVVAEVLTVTPRSARLPLVTLGGLPCGLQSLPDPVSIPIPRNADL